MVKRLIGLAVVAGAAYAGWRLAGGGEREGHRGRHEGALAVPATSAEAQVRVELAAAYDKDILPLFKRACFDCHSGQTRWPWYHRLPGLRQWMDGHVREGREHLDLEGGFPFKGEDSPAKSLRHIAHEVEEGDMAPLYYRVMHSEARLSDAERQAVVSWARQGSDRLAQAAGTAAPGGQGPQDKDDD